MATTKKESKLDSSLPSPSMIRLSPVKAGKDMASVIYTDTDGEASFVAGFKQPTSRKYGYQVQVKWADVTSATDDEDAALGKTWVNPRTVALSTAAKKYNRGTGKPFASEAENLTKGSTVSAGWWLTANLDPSEKSDYMRLYFNGSRSLSVNLTGSVQERIYKFRIRTFNPKKNTHGSWRNSYILRVVKPSTLSNQTWYRATDGGLFVELDAQKVLGWDRVEFDSIRDAAGNELLTAPFTNVVKKDAGRQAAGSADAALKVTVPLKRLARKVNYCEVLAITARFYNKRGAPRELAQSVCVQDTEIDVPVAVALFDEPTGTLVITAKRSSASDDILAASCVASYGKAANASYNNCKYTVKPTKTVPNFARTQGTTDKFAEWTFTNLPLNHKVYITITVSPRAGVSGQTASIRLPLTLPGRSYTLTGITYPDYKAACWGNAEFVTDTTGRVSSELPEGRALPFAVVSKGRTNDMTLTGTILAKDSIASIGTISKWEGVQKHPGAYSLRTPEGKTMRVLVSEVSVRRAHMDYAEVSVTMTEVS